LQTIENQRVIIHRLSVVMIRNTRDAMTVEENEILPMREKTKLDLETLEILETIETLEIVEIVEIIIIQIRPEIRLLDILTKCQQLDVK
jgi:hypothetical protein